MNVMTETHPFLEGKTKRMLIEGKWLEAASGKTFETLNPATGEVLAHVAEGDAEDIDRAVAAGPPGVQWAMEQIQTSRAAAPAAATRGSGGA